MNPALLDKTGQVDLDKVRSAVYKTLLNYSNAVQGKAIVYSGYDSQLIRLLQVADKLGRELVTKNFEISASPKRLFGHLDYYRLIQQLLLVMTVINQYSLKHFGCKWEVFIKPQQASPYALAVINTIRNEATSLKDVKIHRSEHALFMGVEGGIIQKIQGTETLLKVLGKINFLLRQNSNSAANNFDQSIKRACRRNLKHLNGLLHENHKLHFVRVLLPMVGEPNEDETLLVERLKQRIERFQNRLRHKTIIFGGFVGHIKGEIFEWGDLVGIEFIFFFKVEQLGFNFYSKQQEILNYWYDFLNLGLEKQYLKYSRQPYYARNFNVHTVLDHRNISGFLDFTIKNVLPIKLTHLFIKDDFALQKVCDEDVDTEQVRGGSDALQQTA